MIYTTLFYNLGRYLGDKTMKNKALIFLFTLLFPILVSAQLKKDTKLPDFTSVLAKPTSSFFLDFINPEKVTMNHSFTMSFGALGGGVNMFQNAYVNTLNLQFSNNFSLTTNIGIMATPYHTLGQASPLNDTQFFGSAQLNYKFSENSFMILRVEKLPAGYYTGYNNYHSPFSQDIFRRY